MVERCCVVGCQSATHDRKGRKNTNGITFHRFPAWKRHQGKHVAELTKNRRLAWITAVRRPKITFDNVPVSMRVCSLHFHSGQPAYEMMETDPDWAPSLNLGHNFVRPTNTARAARRIRREHQRRETSQAQEMDVHEDADILMVTIKEEMFERGEGQRGVEGTPDAGEGGQLKVEEGTPDAGEGGQFKVEEGTLDAGEGGQLKVEEGTPDAGEGGQLKVEEGTPDAGEGGQLKVEKGTPDAGEGGQLRTKEGTHNSCQKVTQTECDMCVLRRAEINRLLEENRGLRRELNECKISEGFFGDDHEKVKYYTGLPNLRTFMSLFSFLMPLMPTQKKVLTHFQMLLLTFMRLRLDLPAQHLSHMFRISQKTVYRTFNEMVSFLHANLRGSVVWPDRDTLHSTMPQQFVDAFEHRVAVIIDSFEIVTEKPSNPKARTEMFSNQKQSHTMKYLTGSTPSGAICFISKGWGGRTSDKDIILNSGLLDNLSPGDIVLADRGFDIQDCGGMLCAEVTQPASAEGRCQLAARGGQETKKLAHLRVHFKKVLKNVCHKYRILGGNIPITMFPPCQGEEATMLDKIVFVCCALTNYCPV